MELELQTPPAEFVDVDKLSVDDQNPNRMSARQFKALKKSIQRWGFIVPIITNKDFLVADGEHHLRAAKDILYIMEFLGHRDIRNTMRYIQLEKALFNSGNDQFHVKVARNVEEACALVEVGFDYITGSYNDGGKIFRKRK